VNLQHKLNIAASYFKTCCNGRSRKHSCRSGWTPKDEAQRNHQHRHHHVWASWPQQHRQVGQQQPCQFCLSNNLSTRKEAHPFCPPACSAWKSSNRVGNPRFHLGNRCPSRWFRHHLRKNRLLVHHHHTFSWRNQDFQQEPWTWMAAPSHMVYHWGSCNQSPLQKILLEIFKINKMFYLSLSI